MTLLFYFGGCFMALLSWFMFCSLHTADEKHFCKNKKKKKKKLKLYPYRACPLHICQMFHCHFVAALAAAAAAAVTAPTAAQKSMKNYENTTKETHKLGILLAFCCFFFVLQNKNKTHA